MATYGYARVSTREQNLDRQMDALRAFGIESHHIFTDKACGATFERRGYKRLVRKLQPGDVLVIKSIDRLGRNYDEILRQWQVLTHDKGVLMVVLDMPLLDMRQGDLGATITSRFIADMVLQVMSYVAQVEREAIKQRQAEGIAAAKARGVKFGRVPLDRPMEYCETRDKVLAGRVSVKIAADSLGVSNSTFRRWMAADAAAEERCA